MTSVSSSRPPQPERPPAQSPTPARQPSPEDARAMNDALAAARRRMGQDAPPMAKQGKVLQGARDERDAARQIGVAARAADVDAQSFERARHERQTEGQGYGLLGGNAQAAPLPMPAMPSPMADPGAFAQMLADLWTRENGRGSKEVRVRFGSSAWPATGARLVRAEGGALEIALFVGDRGHAYADALPGLEAQLGRSGLAVDRLVLAEDDGLDA